MAGKGKTEPGVSYEEFDSSEFEADQPEPTPEPEPKEGDVKDAKEEPGEGEKLTPEQAFGGADEGKEEAAADDKEAAAADDKEAPESDDASKPEDKPAYEPNFKYKVYDEEKEFPEQLKALVKDKESEELFRSLLAKADGLDEMKPRHQETVRERDEFKSKVEWYKGDINRVLQLRDKQPHLFAAELGISDDWIVRVAREIVDAKDTPEQWDRFNSGRRQSYDTYNQHLELQNQQLRVSNDFMAAHQQQLSMALSHPDVASFQSQFDAVHGLGSFQEEVRKHGNYHYEKTKQSLPAMEAVKHVYEFHKKSFAPPAPQGGAPAAETAPAAARPQPKREVPKPIPNVGKGKNASPTARRFRNIAEMRAYVDKHVPGE